MRYRLTAALLAAAVSPVWAQNAGLDSLDDSRVLTELAGRNLSTLLDHAMTVQNVPPTQRRALLTRTALQRLQPQYAAQLGTRERAELVRQATEGLNEVLPQLNDPRLIMEQAGVLVGPGIQREVDLLRFWGRNERVQARLRPTVEAIIKLYGRAEEVIDQQLPALEEQINQGAGGAVDRYDEAITMQQTAEYTSAVTRYYQTLAMDVADPQRAEIAREAIDYLQQFDQEANPQRAFVQNTLGKLHAAAGDQAKAMELLNAVVASEGAAPDQLFDAYFNRVLVQLEMKDLAGARKAFDEFSTWAGQTFSNNPAVEGLTQILQYRLLAGEARLADSDAARNAADEKANAVLLKLVNDRPDLRDVIFEQLADRLPADPDFDEVDPLLLQALVDQGRTEYAKQKDVDEEALRKAVGAGEALLARDGVDRAMKAEAAFLLPFYHQKLGQDLEAAEAYVNYITDHRTDMERANAALNNAQVLIGQLRQQDEANPRVREAFDRLLEVAVAAPFNRRDLAFVWAYRKQQTGDAEAALRGFAMVPENDPNYAAAQYFTLVSLKDRLEGLPANDPQRGDVLSQINQLSDRVLQSTRHAIAQASGQQKVNLQSRLARVTLLLADLARREQNQPQLAIDLLKDFDQTAQGLPGQDELIGQAINIRFQSLAAAGQLEQATQQLLALLGSSEGNEGISYVVRFLRQVNREFDEAMQQGDTDRARTLAASRAALTPKLVEWARTNSDADIRQFEYRYRVFDADSQRIAANLAQNPAERERLLLQALDRYKDLESQANFDLYRQSLPEAELANATYDPQVVLGIGRLAFDAGDYEEALARFQRLLADRAMGDAVRVEVQDGQTVETDNDQYWEVVYKFIRSNLELGRGVEQMNAFLKREYIKWGEGVGGTLWAEEFEQLRQQQIADFDWRSVRQGTQ